MLGSLRARLIVSFALVVGLAVFLAGAGALFLLRDEQQQTARERYGRYAEPMALRVQAIEQNKGTLADIRALLAQQATDTGLRMLLLDQDLQVVYDSENNQLTGKYILSFENLSSKQVVDAPDTHYRWANYDKNGAHITLFRAPDQQEQQPPPTDTTPGFVGLQYTPIVAISQSKLSSAWLDLVPRLALAGAIALSVSFLVSYFISRSISRSARAHHARPHSQIARGNYDVHIPISGEDEVGRLSEAFNHMAQRGQDLAAHDEGPARQRLARAQDAAHLDPGLLAGDGRWRRPQRRRLPRRRPHHQRRGDPHARASSMTCSCSPRSSPARSRCSTPTSISAPCSSACSSASSGRSARTASSTACTSATCPLVHGDERRLEQVVRQPRSRTPCATRRRAAPSTSLPTA